MRSRICVFAVIWMTVLLGAACSEGAAAPNPSSKPSKPAALNSCSLLRQEDIATVMGEKMAGHEHAVLEASRVVALICEYVVTYDAELLRGVQVAIFADYRTAEDISAKSLGAFRYPDAQKMSFADVRIEHADTALMVYNPMDPSVVGILLKKRGWYVRISVSDQKSSDNNKDRAVQLAELVAANL